MAEHEHYVNLDPVFSLASKTIFKAYWIDKLLTVPTVVQGSEDILFNLKFRNLRSSILGAYSC